MRGRKDQVGQGRSAPVIFSHTGSTEGTNPDVSTPPEAGAEGGGGGKVCTLHRTALSSHGFLNDRKRNWSLILLIPDTYRLKF
jgi:hypothetical protein